MTLVLESDELHFVSQLPDHRFVVFEKNKETFSKLVKLAQTVAPNIIAIRKSDVSKCAKLSPELLKFIEKDWWYEYAFLDFCDSIQTNIPKLYRIKGMLDNSLYIAFTFCLRRGKKEMESYKCSIIKTLQTIFRNHEFDYEDTYRDSAAMFGIILKRRDVK